MPLWLLQRFVGPWGMCHDLLMLAVQLRCKQARHEAKQADDDQYMLAMQQLQQHEQQQHNLWQQQQTQLT